MTAPQSWTPGPSSASAPPPGPPPAPPLIVRPDRAAARRWLTFILVMNGVLAALCLVGVMWASSSSVGTLAGAPFAITLTGCVFQMVFHAFIWGRFLGIDTLAEVGPHGLRGPTTRHEMALLPWSAVASVDGGWNRLVVTPVAGAGPKLSIPTRALDTDASTLRAAITYFSGGRL